MDFPQYSEFFYFYGQGLIAKRAGKKKVIHLQYFIQSNDQTTRSLVYSRLEYISYTRYCSLLYEEHRRTLFIS
jgi:hypothetical protein